MSALTIALLVFGVLALALLAGGVGAWRRRWRMSSLTAFLAAGLLFALAALCGTITVGIRGYRALTHEVVAATLHTEPLGHQRFRATVTLPDGAVRVFELSGDAVYVDAHILKWRPIANLLGLHTHYELDRIAGRYEALLDEQTSDHTVQSVAAGKPVDVFNLAQGSKLLLPLVDAQYGSATFVGTSRAATFEVRVSTTGLLIRPLQAAKP